MATSIAVTDHAGEFDLAVSRHWDDVFRFSLALSNDWAYAEDVAQEAFARLWERRSSIAWDRPVLPWLFVVSRHLVTDRFRRLRRRIEGLGPSLPDESVRVRWLDVQSALATLSRHERAALILTAVQGMSYEEAAELLASTPGALRAAVSRARGKLESAQ